MTDIYKIAAWIPISADLYNEATEHAEYMRAVRNGEIAPPQPPRPFSSLRGRPAGPFRRA